MFGDQIELLHHADAGRDEQQRQMREQAAAGVLHAAALQRPARENAEAVARQQQQQQEQQADHRTRHRQAEAAHEHFAGQLAQQDEAEACDHCDRPALICRTGDRGEAIGRLSAMTLTPSGG